MDRRTALQALGGATALSLAGRVAPAAASPGPRPNLLWISSEDTSPDLGCYGDPYAVTPHLDQLAAEGVRYTRCFTHAGVCAPSRSGLVTGCYPTSIGSPHMRCSAVPPPEVRCFPEYLRRAGWFCTNNAKTDYQFAAPATAWDENGTQAHWRHRAPGQPFFSVVNLTTTHEGQVRNRAAGLQRRLAGLGERRHDPARATLPPYYPDTPVVRQDWAQYHDLVTLMDEEVGRLLAELEADGLAADTIVWYWGDHGRGLPRAKRWLYDSGTHAPLLIRVPERWRDLATPGRPAACAPGTVVEDLVAFVDFAPTVLSLAGVEAPRHFQGQAFLGPQRAAPREYVYGARDRMDETYDLIRMVRDRRFKYLRNYLPHLPAGQPLDYLDQMPTMQDWRRLHAAGALAGAQRLFFEAPRPPEELYDTAADPHEVVNLAARPEHRATLERLRAEHLRWRAATGDIGVLPEPELDAWERPGGRELVCRAPVCEAGRPDAAGTVPVTVACTTAGASVQYRLGDRWQVYTAPVAVPPGAQLTVQGIRLGYRSSPPVTWPGPARVDAALDPPSWRAQLDRGRLLPRAWALCDLALGHEAATARWTAALRDDAPTLRYWAVTLLTAAGRTSGLEPTLRELLRDPAPAVRAVAAVALIQTGDVPRPLQTLAELIREERGSARLVALTAAWTVRDVARPLEAELRRLTAADNYATRLADRILAAWGLRLRGPGQNTNG